MFLVTYGHKHSVIVGKSRWLGMTQPILSWVAMSLGGPLILQSLINVYLLQFHMPARHHKAPEYRKYFTCKTF